MLAVRVSTTTARLFIEMDARKSALAWVFCNRRRHNRMTTELTRYNGYRYVLRRGQSFSDDGEKSKAGRALLMHSDMYVWESNKALVARVESLLQEGFSWYSRNPKSARDTFQTLLAYVRDGAVFVLQENGSTTNVFENGGFTFDPPARDSLRHPPALDYQAWSDQYHAERRAETLEIEMRQRAATFSKSGFPKHIETIAEAGVRNIAARAASALLAVASAIPARSRAFDLGEVTGVGSESTPLGDAAPFEYVKGAASQVIDTVAGVFLTPAEEAECRFQYNADMTECSAWYAAKPSSWGMCTPRAADRLGRWVAGKGEML
jgi:hypothetical protein